MFKRFLKDLVWMAVFILLFNIVFSTLEGTFYYSLIVTAILYLQILLLRLFIKVFLDSGSKATKKENSSYIPKSNASNTSNSVDSHDQTGDFIHFFVIGGDDCHHDHHHH